MRTMVMLLATVMLVSLGGAAVTRAEDEDAGMSIVTPSPDDPPLETPSSKVKASRNPDQPPARGPDPARVYVVVFCDYEKLECGRMRRAVHQLPDEFPGDVRIEIRQIPAYGHPNSEAAALAAFAAHRQGKFWTMNDCLLTNQVTLDDATIERCAQEAKLDMKRFEKDRKGDQLKARMKADRDLVRRFGVPRAPAFTINGRLYVGWGTWELLRGAVDEERRQVAALLKSGKKLPEALRIRASQNVPKNSDALPAYTALVGHLHTGLTGNSKKKG